MSKADKQIKLPRGQVLWETHLRGGVPVAIVTSDTVRQRYCLYNVDSDGKLEKIATEKEPVFKRGKGKRGA